MVIDNFQTRYQEVQSHTKKLILNNMEYVDMTDVPLWLLMASPGPGKFSFLDSVVLTPKTLTPYNAHRRRQLRDGVIGDMNEMALYPSSDSGERFRKWDFNPISWLKRLFDKY